MHKWKSYEAWFLRYGVWQAKFFLTLDHFFPFCFPKNPKNRNFYKMKKTTRDIIILYMCIINENHMMYVFWDMKHDRRLSFCAIFCPFMPLATPKNQNFEKMKQKPGDIIILKKSIKNYDHMLYRSCDMAHNVCSFHFYFELLFDLLKHLKISPFYPSVSKIRARSCMVPDILVTDRLMDGRRKDI